jgi:hypothetical protein
MRAETATRCEPVGVSGRGRWYTAGNGWPRSACRSSPRPHRGVRKPEEYLSRRQQLLSGPQRMVETNARVAPKRTTAAAHPIRVVSDTSGGQQTPPPILLQMHMQPGEEPHSCVSPELAATKHRSFALMWARATPAAMMATCSGSSTSGPGQDATPIESTPGAGAPAAVSTLGRDLRTQAPDVRWHSSPRSHRWTQTNPRSGSRSDPSAPPGSPPHRRSGRAPAGRTPALEDAVRAHELARQRIVEADTVVTLATAFPVASSGTSGVPSASLRG